VAVSKQEAAKPSPQQLSFDLDASRKSASPAPQTSRVAAFVDSHTLAVRLAAIERVVKAGIFSPPKAQVKK
jgi:hypothetical protein